MCLDVTAACVHQGRDVRLKQSGETSNTTPGKRNRNRTLDINTLWNKHDIS